MTKKAAHRYRDQQRLYQARVLLTACWQVSYLDMTGMESSSSDVDVSISSTTSSSSFAAMAINSVVKFCHL